MAYHRLLKGEFRMLKNAELTTYRCIVGRLRHRMVFLTIMMRLDYRAKVVDVMGRQHAHLIGMSQSVSPWGRLKFVFLRDNGLICP